MTEYEEIVERMPTMLAELVVERNKLRDKIAVMLDESVRQQSVILRQGVKGAALERQVATLKTQLAVNQLAAQDKMPVIRMAVGQ